VARGRPEYQVVPVYQPDLLRSASHFDFRIHPSEVSMAVELYAALWNSRPVLASEFGKQVGQVTSTLALRELRDALLQLADPTIAVPAARFGMANGAEVDDWHAGEIARWQPLTGRVLSAGFHTIAFDAFSSQSPQWRIFTDVDMQSLDQNITATEQMVNSFQELAIGRNTIVIGDVWMQIPHQYPLVGADLFSELSTVTFDVAVNVSPSES